MIRNPVRALLGVLGVLALAGCRHADAARATPMQGVVEFDDRSLGFELGGRVATVAAERGATLAVGDVIAVLDDGLERPVREARAADLAYARAQLRLLRAGTRREDVRGVEDQLTATRATEVVLERTLARTRGLASQGAVPTSALDDLEAQRARLIGDRGVLEQRLAAMHAGARVQEVAAAEARVAAAEAALAAEETRLTRYVLRAQHAGVVLERHIEPGEVVGPGAPVVTVADTTHPYVEVFAAQGRVTPMALGAPVSVRVDGDPHRYLGHIEFVGRRLEYTPRFLFSPKERPNLVLRVRVRLDDPGGALHAGVPADVSLGDGR